MAYRNRALLVVALTIFVDAFIFGIIVPVLPIYSESLGFSSFQLGVIFSVYSVALLLLSIPIGIISDRYGKKRVMVAGMSGLAIATICFAFSTTFITLLTTRLLQGVAAAVTWVVGPALVADMYPPRERGGKMGLAMAGNNFGFLIGPAVGGFLYDWGGYRAPFFTAAVIVVLVLAAIVIIIKEPARGDLPERANLPLLLRNQTLLVSGGVILVASIGFGFIDPLLPGYFHGKFAATPLIIGIMFGAISATSIIAQPLFGALSDKLGRVPIIISGMLFTAGVLPLLTFAPTIKTTMLVMGGIGITFGLMTAPSAPLLADAVSEQKGPTSYGAAFGLYNTAFSLGYIIGPLAGGAFVDVLGLKNLFGIYGIVLLCYLPVFLLGTRKFRHPAVGRSP